MIKELIISALPILTIIAQILIIVILFSFFSHNKTKELFKKHALLFSFIVALIVMLGSLFYSEIMGYEPCKLCWCQRILMYPLVLLFGIALLKKDEGVIKYGLVFSFIGLIIAGYHYLLQRGVAPSIACSAVGYSVDCAQNFVLSYGYITIPLMAFTAFLLIFLLMMVRMRR